MASGIIARVRVHANDYGSRKSATVQGKYRGILEFEGEKFSCLMSLDKIASVAPGSAAVVLIEFGYSTLIKPRLAIGSSFTLMEFGIIAEGVVEEILADLEERIISEPARIKLVSELGMDDKLTRGVSPRAAEGCMRVYVPVGTPSGREEKFNQASVSRLIAQLLSTFSDSWQRMNVAH